MWRLEQVMLTMEYVERISNKHVQQDNEFPYSYLIYGIWVQLQGHFPIQFKLND